MLIVAGHYNVPAARRTTGVQFQVGNVQTHHISHSGASVLTA
ncbi:hypothetical protein GGD56_000138 [Rhizobium mongolense]|uniref:Uncharacterized protein n=2 Tax=Rhizobium mongolense TaxID=57676 RepID=A0ABR6IEN6_9HYPH|nr:hypothetical protein [Rhizobium mongolense]TVZ73600.1 hypothetical protein BCL32_1844 [Rhizobium mongolense USDA 1844]